MNNRTKYKRVKINWWIIFMLVGVYAGIYVHMMFSYIHQWGNKPLNKTVFVTLAIIFAIFFIVVGFVCCRFIVTVDDKFVIIKTDLLNLFKVPIDKIKSVNVELHARLPIGGVYFPKKNIEKASFDFVKQTVNIQLKNGRTYQVAIKNAQKIKEEIEKRMITTNIKPQ